MFTFLKRNHIVFLEIIALCWTGGSMQWAPPQPPSFKESWDRHHLCHIKFHYKSSNFYLYLVDPSCKCSYCSWDTPEIHISALKVKCLPATQILATFHKFKYMSLNHEAAAELHRSVKECCKIFWIYNLCFFCSAFLEVPISVMFRTEFRHKMEKQKVYW